MSRQGNEHDDFAVMLISQKETRIDHNKNMTSSTNKFKQEFEIPEDLEHYKKEPNKQTKRKTENFFDLTKDLPENNIVDWPFSPPKKLKRNVREESEEKGIVDEGLPRKTEDNIKRNLEEEQKSIKILKVKPNRIRRLFPKWKLPETKSPKENVKQIHRYLPKPIFIEKGTLDYHYQALRRNFDVLVRNIAKITPLTKLVIRGIHQRYCETDTLILKTEERTKLFNNWMEIECLRKEVIFWKHLLPSTGDLFTGLWKKLTSKGRLYSFLDLQSQMLKNKMINNIKINKEEFIKNMISWPFFDLKYLDSEDIEIAQKNEENSLNGKNSLVVRNLPFQKSSPTQTGIAISENKIDYSRPWTLIVTGQDGAYFIRPRLFKFDDKDNVKIVSFSQLTFRTVAFHLINFLGELDINNLKFIIIQCDMVEVKELVKIRHKITPNIKTSNI